VAPQAITDSGQWAANGLRFATKEEAETTSPNCPWYVVLGLSDHPIRSTTAGTMGGSFATKPNALSPVRLANTHTLKPPVVA
jgi:hypothetical protein